MDASEYGSSRAYSAHKILETVVYEEQDDRNSCLWTKRESSACMRFAMFRHRLVFQRRTEPSVARGPRAQITSNELQTSANGSTVAVQSRVVCTDTKIVQFCCRTMPTSVSRFSCTTKALLATVQRQASGMIHRLTRRSKHVYTPQTCILERACSPFRE